MTLTPEMQKLREAINREKVYIDCLQEVANDDVTELRRKDAEYGGSWKKRGGVGAYMMACRKMDRLEEQLKKVSYDIFAAIEGDTRAEGVLDDVRDLRRYLMLIEAEMIARGVLK
jgi:hypothetical protein